MLLRTGILASLFMLTTMGVMTAYAQSATGSDEITFIRYSNETSALDAMYDGDIDMYFYPISSKSAGNATLQQRLDFPDAIDTVTYGIFVNPAKADGQFNPFSYAEVRFSLNYLIDRTQIVEDSFGGSGTEILSSFTPQHPDYLLVFRELDALGIRYDPAEADRRITEVLAAQGATKINGKWNINSEPITVTFFIRDDDPIRLAMGEQIVTDLESIGFTVNKIYGDLSNAFNQVYGANPADFGWHLYTEAFEGPSVVRYDDQNLLSYYAPLGTLMPGAGNPDHWNYKNSLLDSVTTTIFNGEYESLQDRAHLVRTAVTEGVRESVRIFAASQNDYYAVRDDVNGVINTQGDGIANRFTAINANSTRSDSLTIGVLHLTQGAWNTIGGFGDSYSNDIWNVLHDPKILINPHTGDHVPVRAQWIVTSNGQNGEVDIHDDAVLWSSTNQAWTTVKADAQSVSKVVFNLDLGNWHNGQPMDMNDIMYSLYLNSHLGSARPGDPHYDGTVVSGLSASAELLKGVRVINETAIEIYVDYWHVEDDLIAGRASAWSTVPWDIHAAILEAVTDESASYTSSGAASRNVAWITMLDPDNSTLIRTNLETLHTENLALPGLYDPGADQYRLDRYQASIDWIKDKSHSVISNGPFYLERYTEADQTLLIKEFADDTYPLKRGHWNYLTATDSIDGSVDMGSIISLTGSASRYGNDIHGASELAITDFNNYLEKRGQSWHINTKYSDSETDTTEALNRLKEINADGTKIVNGPSIDLFTDELITYAADNDMLMVSCCSATTSFAIPNDPLFRMISDHGHHASEIASLLSQNKIKVVVPVGFDAAWVNELVGPAVEEFKADGGVADDRISYGSAFDDAVIALAKAVEAQLDKYRKKEVAVLYVGFEESAEFLASASAHPVLGQVRWLGAEMNTVHPRILDNDSASKFVRDVNLLSVQPSVPDNMINQHIRGTLGTDTSVYASFEYDSIWILGLAMLESRSTDAEDVRDAIPDVAGRYVGATRSSQLNENGDLADGDYAVWRLGNEEWILAERDVPKTITHSGGGR